MGSLRAFKAMPQLAIAVAQSPSATVIATSVTTAAIVSAVANGERSNGAAWAARWGSTKKGQGKSPWPFSFRKEQNKQLSLIFFSYFT